MLITYKTEINPTKEQKNKINQTFGTCRFVYNFYIGENQKSYEEGKPFMSAFSFSKWLNNEFLPSNPEYLWIKDVSSKSVKQSIIYGDRAFKKFFKDEAAYPRFKKKNKSNVKMYFVKDGKTSCLCERHRIKIPTLGWVKLKEKGYIPTSKDGYVVRSGTVSCKAGRYYITCVVDIEEPVKQALEPFGLGIDLGLNKFAVISNGKVYDNSGSVKVDLKLSDRIYKCSECGNILDRDLNASLNLRDTTYYKVA